MNKKLLDFSIACPKYRKKVISLNNIPLWYRYQQSKIKNEYKQNLKDFCITTPDKKLTKMFICFSIYRHNRRIFDSDALGFIVKWTIDAIKESGWLVDDNQVTYIVHPSVLNLDLIETEIKVEVYEKINDMNIFNEK